ncbi:MAG: hypothetical protein K0R39_3805 [Symbiobacteriaceae bacterium]|jgi:flagellar motility protein MotE (MotC chaperone)|nr:hypothetical protein [Symbiobacteriaceae bacterium]
MSKPSQTPLIGGRPLAGQLGGGGLRSGPALSPLAPKGKRGGKWLLWLLLIPLLLAGLTYLVGKMVEPVQARLEAIPVVGPMLFDEVWPILWNKSATPEPAAAGGDAPAGKTPTPGSSTAGTTAPPSTGGTVPAADSALSKLMDEAAARLALAEAEEARLKQKEADLKAKEETLKKLQAQLDKAVAETDALKVQLQGQLRSELDKVEFVRNMSRTQQAAFFEALTDAEVVRILKYMTAEEIGKLLGGMNAYRAARIFDMMPALAQPSGTP